MNHLFTVLVGVLIGTWFPAIYGESTDLPAYSNAIAHEFYVSTSEVEFNKEKEQLECSFTVFQDDWEALMNARLDSAVYFKLPAQQKDSLHAHVLGLQYLVYVDDVATPLAINYLGSQGDPTQLNHFFYFKVPPNASGTFRFEVSVLVSLFERQENIITAKTIDGQETGSCRKSNDWTHTVKIF